MPIQTTYRGIPQPDLASYDWFDLATGTGYKNFYGMDIVEGSSSLIYVLTTQEFYAHVGYKTFSETAGEINFDLDLEVPLTIDGVVIVNIPMRTATDLGAKTYTFKIYRVDSAAAEHQLGSTVTSSVTLNNIPYIFAVVFDVGVIRLKAGEKFRLSIANPDPGSGKQVYWMFDPKNREVVAGGGTFISSVLKLSLPIKI